MTRVAALIPARGGSKRLPHKNMARVGGQTLVERAILSSASCDETWVSTDDATIAAHAARLGARVLLRPSHLSGDLTSTESVMTHWWRSLRSGERPDALCLLQPTSPMRHAHHVAAAIDLLETSGADSVVSVRLNPHAHFVGRSYPREGWREFRPFRPRDWRPRTQDARELTEENGAIYITRRETWERTGNRMGGVVAELRMSDAESVDIDTAEDLAVVEALLSARAV
jgi:CMP-N,N'-diacetyllegionaminic acid synthase